MILILAIALAQCGKITTIAEGSKGQIKGVLANLTELAQPEEALVEDANAVIELISVNPPMAKNLEEALTIIALLGEKAQKPTNLLNQYAEDVACQLATEALESEKSLAEAVDRAVTYTKENVLSQFKSQAGANVCKVSLLNQVSEFDNQLQNVLRSKKLDLETHSRLDAQIKKNLAHGIEKADRIINAFRDNISFLCNPEKILNLLIYSLLAVAQNDPKTIFSDHFETFSSRTVAVVRAWMLFNHSVKDAKHFQEAANTLIARLIEDLTEMENAWEKHTPKMESLAVAKQVSAFYRKIIGEVMESISSHSGVDAAFSLAQSYAKRIITPLAANHHQSNLILSYKNAGQLLSDKIGSLDDNDLSIVRLQSLNLLSNSDSGVPEDYQNLLVESFKNLVGSDPKLIRKLFQVNNYLFNNRYCTFEDNQNMFDFTYTALLNFLVQDKHDALSEDEFWASFTMFLATYTGDNSAIFRASVAILNYFNFVRNGSSKEDLKELYSINVDLIGKRLLAFKDLKSIFLKDDKVLTNQASELLKKVDSADIEDIVQFVDNEISKDCYAPLIERVIPLFKNHMQTTFDQLNSVIAKISNPESVEYKSRTAAQNKQIIKKLRLAAKDFSPSYIEENIQLMAASHLVVRILGTTRYLPASNKLLI